MGADFKGLDRIGQIAINVHDLPRAVTFYRERLGVPFLFEVPGMAFFDCGGVRLMLGIPVGPDVDHLASILYYKVDDIEVAYQALVSRGVAFLAKPHVVARMPAYVLWLAEFKDPDGNVLALMSEIPSEVPS
jgi:methylmalonyl-CoA/ethylmalonyl-CoA epimerase